MKDMIDTNEYLDFRLAQIKDKSVLTFSTTTYMPQQTKSRWGAWLKSTTQFSDNKQRELVDIY